jgi:RimJ/RimL family protein N-acetyltransferase
VSRVGKDGMQCNVAPFRTKPASWWFAAGWLVARILRWLGFSFNYYIENEEAFVFTDWMPVLDTRRLVLRSFGADDLDRMAELFANPDFMRFSLGVWGREQTGVFLDKIIGWERDGLPSLFAVEVKAAKRVVGYCGFLHHLELPHEIEIGYRLDPEYWNRGLITEAARAVREHAFGALNLPRVISLIHPDNVPSRRVAEKNGLMLEKQINFRGFPTNLFSLSRDQWLALSGA